MSFSIKWLFAVTAITAIFTAALIYKTPLWALAAVNLTITVLLSGVVGVWLRRFNPTFWIPFCSVGWFYFLFSFTPKSINRLDSYLPSTQIADTISRAQPTFTTVEAAEEYLLAFIRFRDILDALSALVVGSIAGVITWIALRRKPEQ